MSWPSGIVAITGQPGTGKTTTLFSLGYEAWHLGFPISLVTDDKEIVSDPEIPEEWDIFHSERSELSWRQAIEKAQEKTDRILERVLVAFCKETLDKILPLFYGSFDTYFS